jgi:hypothetical protein
MSDMRESLEDVPVDDCSKFLLLDFPDIARKLDRMKGKRNMSVRMVLLYDTPKIPSMRFVDIQKDKTESKCEAFVDSVWKLRYSLV